MVPIRAPLGKRFGRTFSTLSTRPPLPAPHSRLAGSRRPEIRLRFRADLPGQRKQQEEEEEEKAEAAEELLGKMYGIRVQRLGRSWGKFLE
ncbi:hypothetical protein K0M31_009520 [Melipona bicolor]|uniref:Uncharacterized protein n=1 Tax=Melipona bicolor TaxID=60889 RepID=A0AA40KJ84_9HYME|nr:hypothetical protein K0M31_009520 [Melipona bicolor]